MMVRRAGLLRHPADPGHGRHRGPAAATPLGGGCGWQARPDPGRPDTAPPLRQAFGLRRRARCPHPVRNRTAGTAGLTGNAPRSTAACGHAALRRWPGARWESRALPGRPYRPPLRTRLLPFPAVGAHCICAHAAPPGSPGLQSSHPGPGRHVGMLPDAV